MIYNYTPHDIILVKGNKRTVFHPCGLARVSQKSETVNYIDGFPVKRVTYGEVAGLPLENGNDYYIVSTLCAQNSKRNDLIVPCDSIRDEHGVIIGCSSFALV